MASFSGFITYRNDRVNRLLDLMESDIAEIGINEWSGTLRVYNVAIKICESEGGSLETIAPAALLHDLGKIDERKEHKPHYVAGEQRKKNLLRRAGYSDQEIARIVAVIEAHQKKFTPSAVSLEDAILQDADSIDELGLIGLIRSAIWHSKRGDPIYFFDSFRKHASGVPEVHKPSRSIVDHQYDKLLALDKFMNTQTGRKLARRRIMRMNRLMVLLGEEIQAQK